ncbi:hypothetical protein [Methylobacterium sp. SD21]|uniref:hypothetical protein n=1 Tax=Methylobacterium litchii TaxID=3138810 RepID=UPI00313E1EBF
MSNVVAFTPRSRPPEPASPAPLAGLALRAHLEDAAQTALDAADKIIAALDRIDGSDTPQGIETASAPRPADSSASLAQIVRLGDLGDFRTAIPRPRAAREEAPTIPLPEPETALAPESEADDAEGFATSIARPCEEAPAVIEAPQEKAQAESAPAATAEVRQLFPPLAWGGAGNVVAAAGCAVLALVGMRA